MCAVVTLTPSSEPIVVPPHLADKPTADCIAEWQHFTGFLLALSGVSMKGKGGKATQNLEAFLNELMELIQVRQFNQHLRSRVR